MTEPTPEDLVADALKRLVDERQEFLIVVRGPYFVQFAASYSGGRERQSDGPFWDLYAEHGLYAEAVSDWFLEPGDQLGAEGAERLGRLGWAAPTDGSNWTREFELKGQQDCAVVARDVIVTFVDGFRVTGPMQFEEGDPIQPLGAAEQPASSTPPLATVADSAPAQPRTTEPVAPQPNSAPAQPATSTRPDNSRNVAGTVGIARNVSKGVGPYRGKPAALQVWTFRLETYDQGDNPGPLLGVEMRGTEIKGTLENGDWVLITETVKPGEGCRPKEIRNLTTNERVRSKMAFFMAQ
jgi:hypothetical protein